MAGAAETLMEVNLPLLSSDSKKTTKEQIAFQKVTPGGQTDDVYILRVVSRDRWRVLMSSTFCGVVTGRRVVRQTKSRIPFVGRATEKIPFHKYHAVMTKSEAPFVFDADSTAKDVVRQMDELTDLIKKCLRHEGSWEVTINKSSEKLGLRNSPAILHVTSSTFSLTSPWRAMPNLPPVRLGLWPRASIQRVHATNLSLKIVFRKTSDSLPQDYVSFFGDRNHLETIKKKLNESSPVRLALPTPTPLSPLGVSVPSPRRDPPSPPTHDYTRHQAPAHSPPPSPSTQGPPRSTLTRVRSRGIRRDQAPFATVRIYENENTPPTSPQTAPARPPLKRPHPPRAPSHLRRSRSSESVPTESKRQPNYVNLPGLVDSVARRTSIYCQHRKSGRASIKQATAQPHSRLSRTKSSIYSSDPILYKVKDDDDEDDDEEEDIHDYVNDIENILGWNPIHEYWATKLEPEPPHPRPPSELPPQIPRRLGREENQLPATLPRSQPYPPPPPSPMGHNTHTTDASNEELLANWKIYGHPMCTLLDFVDGRTLDHDVPDLLKLTIRARKVLGWKLYQTNAAEPVWWEDMASAIGMDEEAVAYIHRLENSNRPDWKTSGELVLKFWEFTFAEEGSQNHFCTRPCNRQQLAQVLAEINREDLVLDLSNMSVTSP